QTLDAAYQIHVVVTKNRDVYFYENVRIHLDCVEGLGDFLELEAVQCEGLDREAQYALVERLCQQFLIGPDDRLRGSYRELIGNTNA
ncbi:MAG: CYTH domain-containing protein, partial [Planctomycetota bacterium]